MAYIPPYNFISFCSWRLWRNT